MSDFTSTLDQALTEAELDRLDDLLEGLPGDESMSLEEMDGFFSALICAPKMVSMGLVLQSVLGGQSGAGVGGAGADAISECIALATRHWNAISAGLANSKGEDPERYHMPLLQDDERSPASGKEWARGFMHGMGFDRPAWAGLMNDPEHGGAVLPVMALLYENDPDPSLRSGPHDAEQREKIVSYMCAGLHVAWRYFAPQRQQLAQELQNGPQTIVRSEPKIGRNDPCHCGSGRKYKRCHGAT